MNTLLNTHRNHLDTTSRKGKCPECNQRTFVFYVDDTGNVIHETVGRCDRENKCRYHFTPKQYLIDNPNQKANEIAPAKKEIIKNIKPVIVPVDYIDMKFLELSMKDFMLSNFALFLTMLFGEKIAEKLLLKYFVGRSKNDNGRACIYWQIDEDFNLRYGKIMCYVVANGKRKKDISPIAVPVKPTNYLQTFFGCHLLTEHPEKDVAICESEKTAVIAGFFMPQFNWLATGGSNGCKWREYQVFRVLKNKNVVLFPDFGFHTKTKTCYQEWSDRAKAIQERMPCKISVSSLLENNLTEAERDGQDIADFLIKQDKHTGIALTDDDYPAIWDMQLHTKHQQHE